ncbi:MAG: Rrf2 family transcriptional regulator [Acidimicrobiales bacterium]
MTLSKRGDYVLRSAISLARAFEEGVPRKIREVVDETEVPRTFASQILADLVRAGVASSRAGRNGGYWLVRAPEDISVLEVVEAAEGPLHAERCALGEGPCRWEAVCPLHETWSAATAVLRQVLATTTLAEVAARDHSIETGTYPIPADSHRIDPAAVAVADVVHVELEQAVARIRLSRSAHMLGPIVDAACSEAARSERRTTAVKVQRDERHPPSGNTDRPKGPCSEVALLPATSQTSGEQHRHLHGWKLSAQGNGFVLDAALEIAPVDAERSELRLEGTWRQAPAIPPVRLEARQLENLALRTVRSFLRRLAQMLESSSEEPVGT